MTKYFTIGFMIFSALFPSAGPGAGTDPSDHRSAEHSGRIHDEEHGPFAYGEPGDPEDVDRTIHLQALDTMRYDKRELVVRAGETVRFIVTNAGRVRHEFIIGDAAEQRDHAIEMQHMTAKTMHDHDNGITLAPEETKSIVWRFSTPGSVELACHEPGHYESGMISRVQVRR